jgi:radical SAM superfamily enzyme YgiQ (UPF0313 family)
VDILLTHGYFLSEDATEQRVMKPYAPLGILSLSSFLKTKGFEVELFDSTFQTLENFQNTVLESKPKVVGIYVNMVTKFNAIRMISIAKNAGVKVVLGGPEPANYLEEYLAEGADAIVIGEGEKTLYELLNIWSGKENAGLESVAGLGFTGPGNALVQTTAREKIKDINELPVPDRAAIDIPKYLDAWKGAHGYSSVSLITMRGCPYTCKWCSHSVYGESYRRRSPRLVADEIESIMNEYNPDRLWFADDVFTIHHRWLFELEEELLARNLSVRFECITRADRLNDDVVITLARMGCTRVWIGAESGSQRILDAMSRGVKIEQVEAMTIACRAAGIEVGTFIMLGYQSEEKQDIEETVQYLRRAQPDIVLTTVSYPIKGTAFYREQNSNMAFPQSPFSSWNDRDIGIEGRYSKTFYWYASRRLVNETNAVRYWKGPSRNWAKFLPAIIKAKVAQAGMLLHS